MGGALTIGLSNIAISAVPVERSGVASAVHNAFREIGGSFGIAIIGAVFAAAQSRALAAGSTASYAFVSGYRGLPTVGALIVFGATVLAFATLTRPAPSGLAAAPEPAPAL